MELSSLDNLFEDQLKDLYSAENQLLKALPKMARAASSQSLRDAFERHTEQTRTQVQRLQEIGKSLGITLGGKKCLAMEGLIKEGNEVLEMDGEPALIDAALVAAAQRVEHYEISGYGTARAIANSLGHSEVASTLQETLDEESQTDELLTRISEDELLPAAHEGAGAMAESEGLEEESRSSRRQTPGRATPAGSRSAKSSTARTASSRTSSAKGGSKATGGAKSRGGTTSSGRGTTKGRNSR